MILIYTVERGTRLHFTLREVLFERMEASYRITNSQEEYLAWQGPSINYSCDTSLPGIHIPPSGLLQKGATLFPDEPVASRFPWPVPFNGKDSNFFDIFSSAFFLLSRMEEYASFEADTYGRYPASASWSYRNNALHLPLVDVWCLYLAELLNQHWPGCINLSRRYRFVPSVDIDNAYAYRHKPWKRQLASTVKDLLRADANNLSRRIAVLRGRRQDPYDTYDAIFRAHRERNLRANYFVLCARPTKFDRNLPTETPAMQQLIRQLQAEGKVGLHPGFASNSDYTLLLEEKNRLEHIIGGAVYASRQHYLCLSFPQTYRQLIKAGIREDYTMGFADEPGFRAGTSLPFRFYDLLSESESELRIHPFAFMDATLHIYKEMNRERSLEAVKAISSKIKETQGVCISLWHNETLGGIWNWQGWEDFYPEILDACSL